jgi:diguanylate cyclase (GGDEF)-like protein
LEVAVCWSQPGDYNYLTLNSEEIFSTFFKEVKRADMIQSKDFIPVNKIKNAFGMGIFLDDTYLGMLLVKLSENIDLDNLKLIVKSILPQLSLAKYATNMSAEVEKRTSTDKLTGLWNRNYFNERFREECIRLSRTKEQGVVAVISFDELAAMSKVISNQEHTDLILFASNLIRKMLRKTDWVVYWDKHEILIYLTNTQSDYSLDVINRFTTQLLNKSPLLQPLIGLCSTIETDSARALIQLASRRLELARKDSRKMIVCYATKEGLKFIQLNPKVE